MPAGLPLNAIFVIAAPEQRVCDDGDAVATPGAGFTNIVAVIAVPVQPLIVGVMVNVTVTGAFVVFVKAPVISPDPLFAIPVTDAVLFLVQLKVVPNTVLLLNVIGVIAAPEQIVCDEGVAVAMGVGLTSTAALFVQPLDEAVIVNVTYSGAAVVLVNEPLIFPVPLAAIPVTPAVLFLAQL